MAINALFINTISSPRNYSCATLSFSLDSETQHGGDIYAFIDHKEETVSSNPDCTRKELP